MEHYEGQDEQTQCKDRCADRAEAVRPLPLPLFHWKILESVRVVPEHFESRSK